jgi:hypothetical protein
VASAFSSAFSAAFEVAPTAPPHVGSMAAVGGGDLTSGSWTLPAGWQAGDLAIMWWWVSGTTTKTLTPPGTVTQKHQVSPDNYGRLFIGYRWLQSGDTTFAWTSNSVAGGATVYGCDVFRGVAPGSGDPFTSQSGTPVAFAPERDPDLPAVTPAVANSTVWAIWGKNNDLNGTTPTPPTNYTSLSGAQTFAGNDAAAWTCYRSLAGGAGVAEDPGAWTALADAGTGNFKWTVALAPASASGDQEEPATAAQAAWTPGAATPAAGGVTVLPTAATAAWTPGAASGSVGAGGDQTVTPSTVGVAWTVRDATASTPGAQTATPTAASAVWSVRPASASTSGGAGGAQAVAPTAATVAWVVNAAVPSTPPPGEPEPVPGAGGLPKQPSLRVRFTLEPYPLVTPTVYRWGVEPLADAEFTEGRLTVDGYTDVERALSGSDGHYGGGTFSFTCRDDDRLLSGLLANLSTHFWLNREASLELLSLAGRLSGLAWRTMARGVLVDVQEQDDMTVRASLKDVLGSEFSALDLDRAVARVMITRTAFPNAPEAVVGQPYYIPFGEHSDKGQVDQNGKPAEKGMIPLRFLGWAAIGADGVATAFPGTAAWGFLRIDAQPVAGDTVTVGSTTLTFGSGVAIGADVDASRVNLAAAIDALAGVTAGIPDDLGGGPNTARTIVVKAEAVGVAGNSIALATSGTLPAFFHEGGIERTTLWGGADSQVMPPKLAAPTVTATVVGTPGTTPYRYSASAITANGETTAGPEFEVANGPAVLDATNYITISITPPASPNVPAGSVIGYRVLGRAQTSTHLAILNGGGTWANPETTYNDTGAASESGPGAPAVSTALIDIPDPANPGENVGAYAMFGGILGAVKINKLFFSDVGGGGATKEEPKRITLPQESVAELLTPFKDDGTPNPRWPHANPWVTRDGIDSTLVYLQGPRAQDAIDGRVTIAANLCGYDPSGRLTGNVVDDAFLALQVFLNEFVLKNGGEGYRSGAFGPLVTFADGTPILRTSAFTAAQATSAVLMADGGGTGGYKSAWCISDPNLTLRQFLQQFCLTFGCFIGVNEHWQVYPVLLDDTADPLATGKPYREDYEILHLSAPRRAWNEIVNKINYQFDWDTDGKRFRYPPQELTMEASRDGYKGAWKEQDIKGTCTRHATTMLDAQQRRLWRLRYVPTYWTWEVDIRGVEQQLGGIALLTHSLYGLVNHPVMVTRTRFSPLTNRVTLTGLDISRIAA